MDKLAAHLSEHYVNLPDLEIQDAVKFLYQHHMGPGHLIVNEEAAFSRLKEEWDSVPADPDAPLTVPLGNGLCRLNLNRCKADKLSHKTVAMLFILTAQHFIPHPQELGNSLHLVRALPFPKKDVDAYLSQYQAQGCPMVSHSPHFRQTYSPAYRVVSEYYVKLLPVLSAIDQAMDVHPCLRVAIDGPCASGKSTLGAALRDIYRCPLIHMDDFFLRPEQRTPERLEQPGGNVDAERFVQEVLTPLLAGRSFSYRPWSCQNGTFAEPISLHPAPLTVVEGSYSLRSDLRDSYQLRIWVEASTDTRRQRLLDRGGPDCLARFEQQWIPLEDHYFASHRVSDCCHIHLDFS